MNDIQISENKEELTLTTIDIADMMEMPHWQILRKLEGTKKFKGIIQILNDNKIVVVDYSSNHRIQMIKERKDHATK